MRLSILICCNPIQKWRIPLFERLFHNLELQIKFDYQDHWIDGGRAYLEGDSIDVIWDNRERISIGEKRNFLISQAVKYQHEPGYVAFVDDDDNVSKHYIDLLLEGIRTKADCCSLRGIITDDGINPRVFEHSIRHKAYETVDPLTHEGVTYLRFPNHISCMKLSIAQQFPFPAINHSEDTDFATQVFKSGLLKTEHWIDDIIYFYNHVSNK